MSAGIRNAITAVFGSAAIAAALALAGCNANAPAGNAPTAAPQLAATTPAAAAASATALVFAPGARTKTAGCHVNAALQDPACTPGAVFAGVTASQICRSGYATSVRDVSEEEKQQVYAEYGIRSHAAGSYEVDHLISLELGGSNDVSNLWPEAASPTPGFHEKDRYENYAHQQVCDGRLSLPEAQRRIATNWLQYWTDAGRP